MLAVSDHKLVVQHSPMSPNEPQDSSAMNPRNDRFIRGRVLVFVLNPVQTRIAFLYFDSAFITRSGYALLPAYVTE